MIVLPWHREAHSFLLSVDTERPRDFAEVIKIGVDYTIMKTLALRAGYVTHVFRAINAGLVKQNGAVQWADYNSDGHLNI